MISSGIKWYQFYNMISKIQPVWIYCKANQNRQKDNIYQNTKKIVRFLIKKF